MSETLGPDPRSIIVQEVEANLETTERIIRSCLDRHLEIEPTPDNTRQLVINEDAKPRDPRSVALSDKEAASFFTLPPKAKEYT